MGMFDKVKQGLKKASDNAKEEIDLDEGIDIGAVAGAIHTLTKKKKQE